MARRAVVLLLSLLLPVVAAPSVGAQTRRVPYAGPQPDGHSWGASAAAAPFNYKVAYVSSATNLVEGDTNGRDDIFVSIADDARTLIRVSVSSTGTQANGSSREPAISPDGRYVAFVSDATNLVVGDTNTHADVFVHDLRTRQTWRASVAHDGSQPNLPCMQPSVSQTGTIAFMCLATNMVPGDTNGIADIFVADVDGTHIRRVSTTSTGSQAAGGYSQHPSIDHFGQRVAFDSGATNLAPGDTNNASDVFVKDLRTGAVLLVSRSATTGQPANGWSDHPSISGDGEWVAYESSARNLDAGGKPNDHVDIFLYEVAASRTRNLTRVSSYDAHRASVSYSGKFVAFYTAEPLVSTDDGASQDVYLYNAGLDSLTVVSQRHDGSASCCDSGEADPSLVGFDDSTYTVVFWSSSAADLVTGDTNARRDIFQRWKARFPRSVEMPAAVPQEQVVPVKAGGGTNVSVKGDYLATENVCEVEPEFWFCLLGLPMSGEPLAAAAATGIAVTVGGIAATGVQALDPNTLRFTVPPLTTGQKARVVITYADGDVLALPGAVMPMAVVPGSTADTDVDGVPDWWELTWGTDALRNDAGTDVDGDGLTNAQEYAARSHPAGFHARYLAEGATGATFLTRLALANPSIQPASVLLRFLRPGGSVQAQVVPVPATGRATADVEALAGMADAEFATTVESDLPVVADRTMRWTKTGRYGAHAERSVRSAAATWYLAEGATHSGFDLFYLLQNPNAIAANVTVTYLLPSGAPLAKSYTVGPNARFNIWVNHEQVPEGSGLTPLAATDVSAVVSVTNDVPVIVERAMYLTRAGQFFAAGHESAGVTAPATDWFLAEGATGSYFDLFVLIANPGPQTALVDATYLLDDGTTVARSYEVPGSSRFNVWVDYEDARLADAAVSAVLRSSNGVPIIVERAMWWPGGPASWHEAHNSPGETTTGTAWGLAEGEVGGPDGVDTYILVANTSPFAGEARVTLLFEDGTTAVRTVALAASSRTNVHVAGAFGMVVAGRRFGALVESVAGTAGTPQIVVERAVYWDAGGQFWAAGTNALATKLR